MKKILTGFAVIVVLGLGGCVTNGSTKPTSSMKEERPTRTAGIVAAQSKAPLVPLAQTVDQGGSVHLADRVIDPKHVEGEKLKVMHQKNFDPKQTSRCVSLHVVPIVTAEEGGPKAFTHKDVETRCLLPGSIMFGLKEAPYGFVQGLLVVEKGKIGSLAYGIKGKKALDGMVVGVTPSGNPVIQAYILESQFTKRVGSAATVTASPVVNRRAYLALMKERWQKEMRRPAEPPKELVKKPAAKLPAAKQATVPPAAKPPAVPPTRIIGVPKKKT